MRPSILLAVTTASLSSMAIAQTERDLEKHQHGSATLNVAVVTDLVLLELNTPWNNLVGFEHTPRTEEQKALVDDALTILNQPQQLFSLNGGDCTFSELSLESAMEQGPHSDEHHGDEHKDAHGDEHKDEQGDEHKDAHGDEHKDEHGDEHKDEHGDEHKDEHDDEHKDAHGDEHKDEHGDEHKDEHSDEHKDEHSDEASHTAALVSYSYTCGDVAELTSIEVNLFTLWPGFEELDVQIVGLNGQALEELNAEQSVLDIRQVQ